MKKVRILILSIFVPFILVLGFSRKSVDNSQSFLPSSSEILNSLQTSPKFDRYITEDLAELTKFWDETQSYYQYPAEYVSISDVWELNEANFFSKCVTSLVIINDTLVRFFSSFGPFFKMVGSAFKLVGHAIYLPRETTNWIWNTLLGLNPS